MKLLALLSLLILMLQEAGTASLSKEERGEEQPYGEGDSYAILHLGDYVLSLDNYEEVIDPSNYDELTDYGDQLPQVTGTSLASLTRTRFTQSTEAARALPSNPTTARPPTLGLLAAPANHGLPTCLICVCLGSSVYCDDTDLENIPPLPQTTAYLYARFNRISHIRAGDFKGLTKLKRIDLSGNSISSIDDKALRLLPALRDLILPENKLAVLPALPTSIEVLDVRMNRLQSSGIQPEAFRLQQLFLCIQREEMNHPWSTQLRTQQLAEAQETGPGVKERGHISAPHSLGPTEPTGLPRPLPPPQALEKLQFLYLADNLLDAIPRPLPLSLRSLHLQNNMIETMQRDAFCDAEEHRHTRRQLEDIRLDGNPINLSLFPSAYFCLPRLPTGRFV